MTKLDRRYDKMINYLMEDNNRLLNIVSELNNLTGEFGHLIPMELSEVMESMEKEDIARAIIYGNVSSLCARVIIDGYGNFEEVSELQEIANIKANIDYIIEAIEENYEDMENSEDFKTILG